MKTPRPNAPVVGVVLVSHGPSALDLLETARRMGNHLEGVTAVGTEFDEPAGQIQAKVEGAVEGVDLGHGVLVIMDLCGSTPSNVRVGIAHSMRARLEAGAGHDVEILYGLSLPMLAKLSTADRTHGPTDLGREIQESAKRGIRLSSEILGPRRDAR